MLAKTVAAMADENINVLAMHQSMRQVDMQFVIDSEHYELAIQSLHRCLVEIHNHGVAICAG
jgi:aspartate kinase